MSEPAVIGVDLGGTNVRAGKVVGQEIKGHRARAISGRGTEATVLQEISETIGAVFDKEVVGIGIGVPSLVDVDKGIVYTVENIPSWQEVPLKEILERTFHVPVYVNNDANCFALGELYFGAGRGYRDLVGMVLGTGLGAGIVIHGKLYCGRNCGAGEIGTIPFREHTVEYYCSGQFFQNQYGVDGGTLYEQAKKGDAKALERFAVFGDNLGQAVMISLYAYDPEIVVLGSSASKAWPFFEAAMRQRLKDFAWQHALARTIIQPSRTAEIAVLGAAALCYDAKK
jgi:glucokinase